MNFAQLTRYKYFWPIAIVVAVLIFFGVAALFNTLGITGDSNVARQVDNTKTVATKDDIEQNIDALGTSVRQSLQDHAAAKAALADNQNRIKVSY